MLGTRPNNALLDRSVHCRVPAHIPSRIVNADHQIRAKVATATAHDARRGVRSLPTLLPGTSLSVRDGYTDQRRMWIVVEQYGRQVSISDGRKILLRNRQHVREFESPFKPLVPQCTSPPGNTAAVRHKNSASPMPIVSTPTTVPSATAATSVTSTTLVSAAAAVPADASVPDVESGESTMTGRFGQCSTGPDSDVRLEACSAETVASLTLLAPMEQL